jgi:tetratricopeptide (TPR) repeat protein
MMRIAVLLALVASPARSLAQDQPASDEAARQAAKSAKDAGVAAFARKEYEVALEQFQRAHHIYPSPNLMFSIGMTLAELGRDAEALDALQEFLARATDVQEVSRSLASTKVSELDKRLGKLVIVSNVPGSEVSLDRQSVGSTPLARPIRASPGRHVIGLTKTGYLAFSTEVDAVAGEQRRVEAELRAAPAAPISVAARETRPRTPIYRRWWLWTTLVGVAAVVAIGVGVGVGVGLTQGQSETNNFTGSRFGWN